jgi:hypothetical protein
MSSPLSPLLRHLSTAWSAEEDARGRRAGTAPLRHRGTSLSWRGRQTAPRKKDGDVAMGPRPCKTSPRVAGHTCDGDEAAADTRKVEAGKRHGSGRQGGAFIKKVQMRK